MLISIILFLLFELLNFSTTQYALNDILRSSLVASIIAIIFCGIDLLEISMIYRQEKSDDESAFIWYKSGAWFLAASVNAILSWWGISVLMLKGGIQPDASSLMKLVPICVAGMMLLFRVYVVNAVSNVVNVKKI
jgi:hypothetical protein